MGKTTESKKEEFTVELIREASSENQFNQLQDWRKLYEYLSKPVKVNEQSSKQKRIQISGLPSKQSYRKSVYFGGNTVSTQQPRINKRLYSFRIR